MKMEKLIAILFLITILNSCSNKNRQEIQKLKTNINQLKESSSELEKRLDSIETNFIQPFKSYQKIVMNESQISPDSIISKYNALINKYPNSFWSHEAKKRQENVDKNREYWENGHWKFSKKGKKAIITVPGIISCPGC